MVLKDLKFYLQLDKLYGFLLFVFCYIFSSTEIIPRVTVQNHILNISFSIFRQFLAKFSRLTIYRKCRETILKSIKTI